MQAFIARQKEMRTRADRRHERQRMIARYRHVARRWCGISGDDDWIERTARRMAAHGKLCSCIMCGNQRRIDGPTLQELRADGL